MIYKKKENTVAREIAGETILVPVKGRMADLQKLFALDGIGGYIWDRIDGRATLDEIGRAVAEEFEVEPGQAEKDIQDFIAQLCGAEMIEEVR